MELLKYYIRFLLKLPKFLLYFIYDLILYIKNKGWKEFYGWGLHVYVGKFGASKTISMVEAAYRLACRYPQLHIMTNLKLNVANNIIYIMITTKIICNHIPS